MGMEQYLDKAYAFTSTLILVLRKAAGDEAYLVKIFDKVEEYVAFFKKSTDIPSSILCRKIYKELDMIIEQEKPVDKISCRAGCAHCCGQFVAVSRAEAAHLKKVAKAKGIELDRERLKKQSKMKDMEWHHLPIADQPCVFLDEGTKMCRVYADRPLNCRKYFVVGDPDLCNINTNRTMLQPIWFQMDAEIVSTAWMTVSGCENLATLLLEGDK